jgi:hypothetical protein
MYYLYLDNPDDFTPEQRLRVIRIIAEKIEPEMDRVLPTWVDPMGGPDRIRELCQQAREILARETAD